MTEGHESGLTVKQQLHGMHSEGGSSFRQYLEVRQECPILIEKLWKGEKRSGNVESWRENVTFSCTESLTDKHGVKSASHDFK